MGEKVVVTKGDVGTLVLNEPPALFDGATHRRISDGMPVKAVHWKKDGDHPMVVRYPIERREFKGLLEVNPKMKIALCFGDWILADNKGRMWSADAVVFAETYAPIETAKA